MKINDLDIRIDLRDRLRSCQVEGDFAEMLHCTMPSGACEGILVDRICVPIALVVWQQVGVLVQNP